MKIDGPFGDVEDTADFPTGFAIGGPAQACNFPLRKQLHSFFSSWYAVLLDCVFTRCRNGYLYPNVSNFDRTVNALGHLCVAT
jgi:hypothetical protein